MARRKTTNTLSQDPVTGKWTIKNIRHDEPANVKIPATFTYMGNTVTFEIENEPKDVYTEWVTDITVPIDINQITREYTPTVVDGKKYIVQWDEFTVVPGKVIVITHDLVLEPNNLRITMESADTKVYAAHYCTYEDGKLVSSADVTSDAACTWTSSKEEVVTVNKGTITSHNTDPSEEDGAIVTVEYLNKKKQIDVIVKAGEDRFDVNPKRLTFEGTGGTEQIYIFNPDNAGWEIQYDSRRLDWLSFSETGGTETKYVNVIASQNTSSSLRLATVYVSTTNGKVIELGIVQSPGHIPTDEFSVSPTGLSFTYDYVDEKTVDIVYDRLGGQWSLYSKPEWVHVTPTQSDHDENVEINVDENTSFVPRNDYVVFKDTTGEEKSVYIHQDAAPIPPTPTGDTCTYVFYFNDSAKGINDEEFEVEIDQSCSVFRMSDRDDLFTEHETVFYGSVPGSESEGRLGADNTYYSFSCVYSENDVDEGRPIDLTYEDTEIATQTENRCKVQFTVTFTNQDPVWVGRPIKKTLRDVGGTKKAFDQVYLESDTGLGQWFVPGGIVHVNVDYTLRFMDTGE